MRAVIRNGWIRAGYRAGLALLTLSVLVLGAGCGKYLSSVETDRESAKTAVHGVTSGVGERAEATVGASVETMGTTTSGPTEGAADIDAQFGTDQRAEGGEGRGANLISAVRFGKHEDYERVVLDLGMGGRPVYAPPEWTLEHRAGDGVLRVTFPSIEETRVSNGRLEGSLLKGFYVVRAPEEGLFVDVFAREDFRYRVMELSDPARIVMDFRATGDPLKAPLPVRSGNTIVVEPQRGSSIGDPFTVSGYSRNPEATNTVIMTGPDGSIKVRKAVQSNDWTSTWGYFETTLDPPAFEGSGTLKVGTPNARDGGFEGVEIPVKRDYE